jgi:hypothetical protein
MQNKNIFEKLGIRIREKKFVKLWLFHFVQIRISTGIAYANPDRGEPIQDWNHHLYVAAIVPYLSEPVHTNRTFPLNSQFITEYQIDTST